MDVESWVSWVLLTLRLVFLLLERRLPLALSGGERIGPGGSRTNVLGAREGETGASTRPPVVHVAWGKGKLIIEIQLLDDDGLGEIWYNRAGDGGWGGSVAPAPVNGGCTSTHPGVHSP